MPLDSGWRAANSGEFANRRERRVRNRTHSRVEQNSDLVRHEGKTLCVRDSPLSHCWLEPLANGRGISSVIHGSALAVSQVARLPAVSQVTGMWRNRRSPRTLERFQFDERTGQSVRLRSSAQSTQTPESAEMVPSLSSRQSLQPDFHLIWLTDSELRSTSGDIGVSAVRPPRFSRFGI